ncbi:MAG: SLC13 family permease [Myxococcota bacterium]|nr:SLC13 family permease [Myxococcota bacterium]
MPEAVAETIVDPHVPTWVTALFGAILVLMVLALALEEKLHAKKSFITGVAAVVSLALAEALHLLPTDDLTNSLHEHVEMPVYIAAIDWGVIAIILGSSIFVDVTSKSGLFAWIAIRLTRASKGDPFWLLVYYGLMTVVFSAMLNNVTSMIIVGSLSGVSLKKLKRTELLLGFLMVEGLLTNIGGLLTLISSVPNIIVGQTAGISFVDFFLVASPYVVVGTAVTLLLGARLFGIRRLTDDEREEAQALVDTFDENESIESRGFFTYGAVMSVLFIVAIATASVTPVVSELGMGFVALAFAAAMLLRFKSEVDRFYQAVDWDLIGFFAALFIVINVMEHAHVLEAIGVGLAKILELPGESGTLLVSAAAASSVTDNIPLAAMLANILRGLGTAGDSPLWWSVVFGANLGGNLTPIGSASTVVAVTLMNKHRLGVSFGGFVRRALPFAAVQLILAVAYVMIFL